MGHVDERVGADVERGLEPRARGGHEGALEVLLARERDPVDQHLERAELPAEPPRDRVDGVVAGHVALEHQGPGQGGGELLDRGLEPLRGVGHAQARAGLVEAPGDRPRQAAVVRHPHDQRGLSVEQPSHGVLGRMPAGRPPAGDRGPRSDRLPRRSIHGGNPR